MRIKNWSWLLLVGLGVLSTTAGAIAVDAGTFRTTAILLGLVQDEDPITHAPRIETVAVTGHGLVDLAMGRPVGDTTHAEQVLAMTIACDLGSAQLVVFDRSNGASLATIAESTSFDALRAQGARVSAPNRAHFVARFDVNGNGNATNGIVDGFATVAGRLNLDPQTGCPRAVLVSLDRDANDKLRGDGEISSREDLDEAKDSALRAGHAHLIGVLNLVTSGTPEKVLVPVGRLSLRRGLPDAV
jgi:hypothetical protein